MSARFRRLLVANRGEIALRVIREARALGLETVAVFSDADREALHVREADQAVRLGPAPAAASYLSTERLLAAAAQSGAQAVHPGYGFLSERADFARAVQAAGLIFVGPDPSAMEALGNKVSAKARMEAAGVPCLPGYRGADQTDAQLAREGLKLGLPLMIKAAAGGGGRGMRLVTEPGALDASLRAARSEAQNAFGDGQLFLERALLGARHVEVQVFGDRQGQVVHLGERDCSVQRRHQKVVEECPSPAVDPALRAKLGEAAVAAAKAVGYVGAGTVEFLLDAQGHFYFLEMNTRLQVEHAVTELVYGVNLVAWQLAIAQGEPLPRDQAALTPRGHAIEVRLCAEDSRAGDLPQTGEVLSWRAPAGEGVRVDSALETGVVVTPFYDSLQAKILAFGPDREAARIRLAGALRRTELFGVLSNRDQLRAILESPAFATGPVTTSFLLEHPELAAPPPSPLVIALAAAASWLASARTLQRSGLPAELVGWQSGLPSPSAQTLRWRDQAHAVSLTPGGAGQLAVVAGGETFAFTLAEEAPGSFTYEVAGRRRSVRFLRSEDALWLDAEGACELFTDATHAPAERAETASDGRLLAPSDARVLRVAATVGAVVARGDPLLVLESMKMELQLTAPLAGTVTEVRVQPGAQVKARQLLVQIA